MEEKLRYHYQYHHYLPTPLAPQLLQMKRWGKESREEEPQKTQSHSHSCSFRSRPVILEIVVVAVVIQTVGSISSKTLAYTTVCTTSMIATSSHGHLGNFLHSVCPNCSCNSSLFCCLQLHLVGHSRLKLF